MAYDYINHIKDKQKQQIPLLSVRDVRLLIIAYLSQAQVNMEKEISDLMIRHQQRIKDVLKILPAGRLILKSQSRSS